MAACKLLLDTAKRLECFDSLPDGVKDTANKTTVKAQHGYWQVICKSPDHTQREQCAVEQDVAVTEQPDIQVVVQIVKFPDGAEMLRVWSPANVTAERGLGIRIDKENLANTKFSRCKPNGGCVAEIAFDSQISRKFTKGRIAWFIVYLKKDKGSGLGIPVELNELSAALMELK